MINNFSCAARYATTARRTGHCSEVYVRLYCVVSLHRRRTFAACLQVLIFYRSLPEKMGIASCTSGACLFVCVCECVCVCASALSQLGRNFYPFDLYCRQVISWSNNAAHVPEHQPKVLAWSSVFVALHLMHTGACNAQDTAGVTCSTLVHPGTLSGRWVALLFRHSLQGNGTPLFWPSTVGELNWVASNPRFITAVDSLIAGELKEACSLFFVERSGFVCSLVIVA